MTQPQKGNSDTCFSMMNFEDIMLSEIGRSQKDEYRSIPFIRGP